MYKLFLTLRYLRYHRIVYFCIVGVSLGIGVLTVVVSIMNGFSFAMKERIRGMQAHLTVRHRINDLWLADHERIVEEIRRIPHVVGVAPRIEYGADLSIHGAVRIGPVAIMGIDPASEPGASDLLNYFRDGGTKDFSFQGKDGAPPRGLAAVVGVHTRLTRGRPFTLNTVRFGVPPAICTREFETVGLFRTGMTEHDSGLIVMSLKDAQSFLRLDAGPSLAPINRIAIRVDDYKAHGKEVRSAVTALLSRLGRPHYVVVPWERTKATLLRAVEVEKTIQIILMFFIILVAGFNIVAVYTLMARSKTHDIGVVKALGGSTAGVATIFLLSGVFLAMIGSFIGVGWGLLLSYYANDVAGAIETATRHVSNWSTGEKSAASVGCLFLVAGMIWIRVRAYLKRPTSGRLWIFLLIPSFVLGLWLVGFLSVKLVQAIPSTGWKFALAILLGLLGATYLAAVVHFARRLVLERRLRTDLLEVIALPAGITYWLIAIAAAALSAVFAAMAIFPPEPNWGLVLFPRDIYYLDRIPATVDYNYVVFSIVGAAIVGLVASIFPAIIASRQPAIESIRHE